MSLFQYVCHFEGTDGSSFYLTGELFNRAAASSAIQPDIPSSQGEEVFSEKAESRKTVRTTSTRGNQEDDTCIEYTEVLEHRSDINCPVIRFLWRE